MTTIVTFLGDRGALQTTYSYQGKHYKGGVFAEALRQFCEFERMIVCVTEKARDKTWSVLEMLNDPRIEAIDIPTGQDTSEMWQTFQIISKEIAEREDVIFDITHGLRSLPFLVFLFAAYLKSAKGVSIKGIYYGALELRNPEGIAPVIDLSEFVSMIDWITATTRFTEMGNGQALVDLLRKEIPSPEELKNNPDVRPLRASLENTAKAIETISLALSTTRPIEVMESAAKLETTLTRSADAFGTLARPFQLLSDRVLAEYGQFSLARPKDREFILENLEIQRQTIGWYMGRNYIVQALTLARELVVSLFAYKFNVAMLDRDSREPIERGLSLLMRKLAGKDILQEGNIYINDLAKLVNAKDIANLWSELGRLRNDLAHCGMNRHPMAAEKIRASAIALMPSINNLFAEIIA
jgi:CRISPR-associated DxTHG motif protein